VQHSRWLGVPPGEMVEDHVKGIKDSIRFVPCRADTWMPPGLEVRAGRPVWKMDGKNAADVVEALIGIYFEQWGYTVTKAWLANLSLLPGGSTVRQLIFVNIIPWSAVGSRTVPQICAKSGCYVSELFIRQWKWIVDMHLYIAADPAIVQLLTVVKPCCRSCQQRFRTATRWSRTSGNSYGCGRD
jgi:hypothetical protein